MKHSRTYRLYQNTKQKGLNIAAAVALAVTSIGTAVPFFVSSSASAATLNVCNAGCTYSTIQAAVDAAQPGDTISVAAGTYNENVNINKTLTLLGAKAGTTAVGRVHGAPGESMLPGSTSYTPTFLVSAPDVTIDGFDFGPASDGATAGPIGVDLGNSSGASVKNSIFEHNQRGISLAGASNVTISGDQVAYNNADSAAGANAGIWGDAVTTISVSNSEFDGASNTAINLATGSASITISHNVFNADGNSAVIWQDSNVMFSSNTGSNFTGSGLYVAGTSNVSVTNNTFTNGPASAVTFTQPYDGFTPMSSNVTVTGNSFSGFVNGVNVYYVSDTANIHKNNFAGSTNGVVNSNGSPQANATQNWWGSTTGPSDLVANDGSTPATNPGGTGATALGAVNYSEWCTNAGCYNTPTNKDQCKDNGYLTYTDAQGNGFKNQGQCVSYTNGRGQ